ncbi:MAG: porin [Gammaproteobacteria bacterium]|nr:porin [Gammaproteobacteria bacterium]MBU1442337.1 porin [Gammaproteobacteria bacterium]MBU2286472.1 porin [Gammaproteobacteria bacterium]MBU2410088.1 porin [Gammaproteobacteria bacterium]
MKKSLVALATLAVAGVASAQSSVTLFGVVDAAVSGYSNKSNDVTPYTLANFLTPGFTPVGSIKTSQTALSNSGYNSSRLGFRGTEDLGGGLAASFWLEAPITNDDGATGVSTFARRSTVSLSGGFGEIRLGRDYKPTFWNHTVFDPFGTNGVGTNLIQTAGGTLEAGGNVRASNSVGYFLPPNLGGFYGQVMYAFHERTSIDSGFFTPATGTLADTRSGGYAGGRFGFANGPLDVAIAYGRANNVSNFQLGRDEYAKNANIGASYDFGVVKLYGEYSEVKNSTEFDPSGFGRTDASTKTKGYLVGLTAPVGPGLIRASFSHVRQELPDQFNVIGGFAIPVNVPEPRADKFALGYVHNLSKRTALYATVARISNKNGAGYTVGGPAFATSVVNPTTGTAATLVPKTSIGYDIGIRHAF